MGETPFTEELARARQGDLMRILTTMATKEDVREMREEMAGMKGTIADIKGDVANIKKTMATKADLAELHETLVLEINHGTRAMDTDKRLLRLEKKVGIPTSRVEEVAA